MELRNLLRLPAGLLILLLDTVAYAQTLPYIPTQILEASRNGNQITYILEPPSNSLPAGQLLALQLSSTLSSNAALPVTTLSSSLPFVDQQAPLPFTSSVDFEGEITILSGNCTAGAAGASIWKFTLDPSLDLESSNRKGTWTKQATDLGSSSGIGSDSGSNYLASSVSFSPTSKNAPSMYVFGGMCPNSTASDVDWTQAAAYSNQLVLLEPDNSPNKYDFQLAATRGQPIAEAGFSITPLNPTFSNATDGSGAVYDQQDFILLGGHTGNAFINMSQVALFSLPQTSWTFLPVIQDSNTANPIEPRSGHTALLTSDGSKVIMFGGWVGDVSTPAEPQLAILDIGIGYGGSGQWTWSESSSQVLPFKGGAGIYGHGTTMLPGDIMLIVGGYNIVSSGSKLLRRTGSNVNAQNYFYNVSSGSWLSSYKLSAADVIAEDSSSASGLLSTKPQKVGLGVGLTFGILAVIVAALVGWFFMRKLKRQRIDQEYERELEQESNIREKEISDLARIASPRPNISGPAYNTGVDIGSNADQMWRVRHLPPPIDPFTNPEYETQAQGPRGPNVWEGTSLHDAERSGLELDVPSPNRGLRRSQGSRGHQYSHSRYDSRRLSHGSGIHPIAESDEEEMTPEKPRRPRRSEMSEKPRVSADEDPFIDAKLEWVDVPARPLQILPGGIENYTTDITPSRKENDNNHWLTAGVSRSNTALTVESQYTEHHSPGGQDSTCGNFDQDEMLVLDQPEHNVSNVLPESNSVGAYAAASMRSLRIFTNSLNPFAPASNDSPGYGSFPQEQHSTASNILPRQVKSSTKPPPSAALLNRNVFHPDTEPTFTYANQLYSPTRKKNPWSGVVRKTLPPGIVPGMFRSASRSASLTSATARAAGLMNSGPAGGFASHDSSSASSSPIKASYDHRTLDAYDSALGIHMSAPQRSLSDSGDAARSPRARQIDDAARSQSFQTSPRPEWNGVIIPTLDDSEASARRNTAADRSRRDVQRNERDAHRSERDREVQRSEKAEETRRSDNTAQAMYVAARERLHAVKPHGSSGAGSDERGTGSERNGRVVAPYVVNGPL